MCANLARLEDDLKALEAAGIDEIHFDIMDGLFVPNFTLGFGLIEAARRSCGVPFSAHLMVTHPEPYIERFARAGCASITVHVETCVHAPRVLDQIRAAGASPGIALNPATPLTKLEYLLDYADRVLVMAVDPGYAGQKLIPNAFERVRILRQNIEYRKLSTHIEVDGNIDLPNGATFVNAGADILVLGTSSIFKGANCAEDFKRFKAALPAQRHLV